MLEVSNLTEEIAGEVEEVEFLSLLRSTVLEMEVEEVEAEGVVLQVFLQSEVAGAVVEVAEEAEAVVPQKRNLYSGAREATAMGTWRVVAVEVV